VPLRNFTVITPSERFEAPQKSLRSSTLGGEIKNMKIISATQFPKAQDYTLAASLKGDMNKIASLLGAKLTVRNYPAYGIKTDFSPRYRAIYFALDTGRFGIILQDERKPARLEINLKIKGDEFFYEADLLEISMAINRKVSSFKKLRGDLKWIQNLGFPL
jgi:hypothetical protein